jgi:Bacterial PH domain
VVSATDGRRRVVRRGEHIYVLALLYAICLTGCGALALGVGAGQELAIGVRVAFAIAGLAFVLLVVRTLRIGAYPGPDGVLIRNVTRSRRLSWSQIERFEIGEWRGLGSYRCGVARLVAGGQVVIFALNPPFEGVESILPLLDELNAQLAQALARLDA